LNRTASALWELLQAGTALSELEAKLRERFDADPAELRGDIDRMIRDMTEAGLVKV
jgi:hypothetical protein